MMVRHDSVERCLGQESVEDRFLLCGARYKRKIDYAIQQLLYQNRREVCIRLDPELWELRQANLKEQREQMRIDIR